MSLEQTYLLVFAPNFAFSSPSSVAYASGSAAYEQNRGMDSDGDGVITVSDIASKIRSRYSDGASRPRVPVTDDSTIPIVAAFSVAAIGAVAGWYLLDDPDKK